LNIKQLEVFVAVAESGSFSRGAEATFITQSTVSQHISSLEKELGVKLLHRTAKGALLTEGGKILLLHARRVISETRNIQVVINRFKGLEDVSLSVAASNIPGNYMIPEALPVLRQRFPRLSITVLQGDSSDVLGMVAREEVELGIVGSRSADESFVFTPVGCDRIILAVGRSHPWADRESAAIEELPGQEFVFREKGSGTGKTVTDALAAAGIEQKRLKVLASLGSNEGVKHAVALGTGISFLPELSVRQELRRGELREVAVEGLEITRQFYLTSLSGRELSPAAAAFSGVMLEIYD
jgi:DNA-binding transcriptional LysR family regulator